MKRKSTSQETYYVDIIDLIIDFVVGRANMVTIFVLPPKLQLFNQVHVWLIVRYIWKTRMQGLSVERSTE